MGTGTCQAIQGVGLCTYATSQTEKLALPPVTAVEMIAANPTHYGDPKGGCESDEQAVQVQGVPGDFCSPKCKAGACPTDMPSGDTATPTCALKTPTGDQYCALICTPSVLATNGANGECGTGTCQAIQGVGLCTYATSQTEKLALPPVTTVERIAANPMSRQCRSKVFQATSAVPSARQAPAPRTCHLETQPHQPAH